jgi:predicted CXXCH cytochrome family protein
MPKMKRNEFLRIVSMLFVGSALLIGGLAGPVPAQDGASRVAQTRHNLTAGGPGTVKTGAGGEVCRFCHTPHAANPIAPLWNRDNPGTYYQTYESTTLEADVGQPTGSSRLCLSCHDGTIALSQTYNQRNAPAGGTVFISQADRGYIGTDLSDDHPISFVYDAGLAMRQGELRQPGELPLQLPLDDTGQLQCTTCHEPHDNSHGQFLRMDNTRSQLCRSCHAVEGWASSTHAVSPASLASARRDQWLNLDATTVREAACEACHRPHSAGGRQRLLRHEAEEDNCFNCHDGSVASGDLASVFRRASVHPVSRTTGTHDPTENNLTMTEHVECSDCHDAHATGRGQAGRPPFIQPAMAGAPGTNASGSQPSEATYEYEVCYRCHSQRNFADPVVARVLGNNNIAEEFSPANASYHPVEAQGRNNDVPSLKQGYTTTDLIYCSDCHGNDDPDGPRGPHGSRFDPILRANYRTIDRTTESPQAYAGCYRCHNRASILNNQSFPEHREHIVDQKTPCSVCHDPHGVARNTHLINFDRLVVDPSESTGRGPEFVDLGRLRGTCTLKCHGVEHVDEGY